MCDWLPSDSAECFSQEQRSKEYTGDGSYASLLCRSARSWLSGPAPSRDLLTLSPDRVCAVPAGADAKCCRTQTSLRSSRLWIRSVACGPCLVSRSPSDSMCRVALVLASLARSLFGSDRRATTTRISTGKSRCVMICAQRSHLSVDICLVLYRLCSFYLICFAVLVCLRSQNLAATRPEVPRRSLIRSDSTRLAL
jgi:hypothetical protein